MLGDETTENLRAQQTQGAPNSGKSPHGQTSMLPVLPARAKPQIDQLGFRQQGTRAVKGRLNTLREKLSSLDAALQHTKAQQPILLQQLEGFVEQARDLRKATHEGPSDLQHQSFDSILNRAFDCFESTGFEFMRVTASFESLHPDIRQVVEVLPFPGLELVGKYSESERQQRHSLDEKKIEQTLRGLWQEGRQHIGEKASEPPEFCSSHSEVLRYIDRVDYMISSRIHEQSLGLPRQWRASLYYSADLSLELTKAITAEMPGTLGFLKARISQHRVWLLERLLLNTNKLLLHIARFLNHFQDLVHSSDLRNVLDIEKRLEETWLDWLSESTNEIHDRETKLGISRTPALGPPIYKRLKTGEFRMLVVEAAPEPFYPLLCRLETWPLQNAAPSGSPGHQTCHSYAALSYCWGPEEYSGRVYLRPLSYCTQSPSNPDEWTLAMKHATPVPIRENLLRALFRLRSHGPHAQPVALWVDSICINQDDPQEKSEQLARLVNIYNHASNVCVWLGESDNEGRSDEAMKFITTIVDFAVLDRHSRDKQQASKWYALGELMRDRWFSRRWVVQEIALAREATVHCGGSVVAWSDFADAASLLVSSQESIKSLFEFSEWREGRETLGDVSSFGAAILLESISNLFRRKANGDIQKPNKTIEHLVTSLNTFDTSDRRDLIYSLVSIASDTSYHLWNHGGGRRSNQPAFVVDYTKSEFEVYEDFTTFCISASSSLDIICRPWAMPPTGRERLPSWIPLLSRSEFGIPDEVYRGRKNGQVLVGSEGSPNYEASADLKCNVRFQSRTIQHDGGSSLPPEQRVLIAKGFRLAKITETSARSTGGVIFREALEMGGWTGISPETDSVPDTIWRTLVADRDDTGKLPPSWYQRACLRCLEIADRFHNGDLNVGEALKGPSEMLRKYLQRVRNVTRNRRFFKAELEYPPQQNPRDAARNEDEEESPTVFGLCPPDTKAGDLICILHGCSVPVILREEEDGFVKLVGESYVHGKMDGEAVTDFEETKTWEVEEFSMI